jgi:multiple sugar transport system ATP-binding protein
MSLRLSNIGRRAGQQWILRHLELTVSDGECLALVGPSGCGKSTTLRLIAGLDPADEGTIELGGRDITHLPAVQRRIGMVFQSYALFPHLSVADNLDLGLKIRGIAIQERRRRVSDVLERMRLKERAAHKPAQLSGGQRQRVALARALLRDPLIYLMDEPMSNLDAQLREDLRPELRQLVLRDQKPVLYVTHDQHEAMAMADRIAVLHQGRLEQIGTPSELYRDPVSLFVATFIGRPQINLLHTESSIVRGVRPEALQLQADGLPCRLTHLEWLGASQLWYLDSPQGALRMVLAADSRVPETIRVGWRPQEELRFDAVSGQRHR